MLERFATLFPHEQEELLAALRRDLRSESCRVETDPEHGLFHEANCRVVTRLLETLSPKQGPRLVQERASISCGYDFASTFS